MQRSLIVLLLCFIAQLALAVTIGPVGKTYPIIEEDLLLVIQQRLKQKERNGEVKMLRKLINKNIKRYLDKPNNGPSLPRAKQTRQWRYDDTIVVNKDYYGPYGEVMAKKGQKFSISDYLHENVTHLYIDADDPEQRAFAKQYLNASHLKPIKLILTSGSIVAATEEYQRKVYFDQHGRLAKVFGIQALPAMVDYNGPFIKIIEVGLGE